MPKSNKITILKPNCIENVNKLCYDVTTRPLPGMAAS